MRRTSRPSLLTRARVVRVSGWPRLNSMSVSGQKQTSAPTN